MSKIKISIVIVMIFAALVYANQHSEPVFSRIKEAFLGGVGPRFLYGLKNGQIVPAKYVTYNAVHLMSGANPCATDELVTLADTLNLQNILRVEQKQYIYDFISRNGVKYGLIRLPSYSTMRGAKIYALVPICFIHEDLPPN